MRTLQQHRSREVRSCSRPGRQHRLVHKVVCRSTVTKTTESAETPTTRTQTLQPTPAQTKQQPYRVTQATIDDIKAFHKSQLCEYDYIAEEDWVRGSLTTHDLCKACSCACTWPARPSTFIRRASCTHSARPWRSISVPLLHVLTVHGLHMSLHCLTLAWGCLWASTQGPKRPHSPGQLFHTHAAHNTWVSPFRRLRGQSLRSWWAPTSAMDRACRCASNMSGVHCPNVCSSHRFLLMHVSPGGRRHPYLCALQQKASCT